MHSIMPWRELTESSDLAAHAGISSQDAFIQQSPGSAGDPKPVANVPDRTISENEVNSTYCVI